MYRKKKLKSVQLKNKNKEKPGENPGFFYCTYYDGGSFGCHIGILYNFSIKGLVSREKVEEKKNENCNYWGREGWS
jgi:hypothetical protein